MATLDGVFTEAAAALQFPSYFGSNKDAFNECISDLEWLPPGEGYVLVLTSPEEVLHSSPPTDLLWLVSSLRAAANDFAINDEGYPARPPIPFHVVLASQRDSAMLVVENWSTDHDRVQLYT